MGGSGDEQCVSGTLPLDLRRMEKQLYAHPAVYTIHLIPLTRWPSWIMNIEEDSWGFKVYQYRSSFYKPTLCEVQGFVGNYDNFSVNVSDRRVLVLVFLMAIMWQNVLLSQYH